MLEINDFLKEGPLTGSSPLIEVRIKDIKTSGDNVATAIQIIEWINKNFKKGPQYSGQYNAPQLFELMKLSDYLDYSVVFSVAARAKKIPTMCVEAISIDTLAKWQEEPMKYVPRHYFVEIYNGVEWVVARMPNRAVISGPDRYLLYGKLHRPTGIGLDYMGINNRGPIEQRIKQVLSKQP